MHDCNPTMNKKFPSPWSRLFAEPRKYLASVFCVYSVWYFCVLGPVSCVCVLGPVFGDVLEPVWFSEKSGELYTYFFLSCFNYVKTIQYFGDRGTKKGSQFSSMSTN